MILKCSQNNIAMHWCRKAPRASLLEFLSGTTDVFVPEFQTSSHILLFFSFLFWTRLKIFHHGRVTARLVVLEIHCSLRNSSPELLCVYRCHSLLWTLHSFCVLFLCTVLSQTRLFIQYMKWTAKNVRFKEKEDNPGPYSIFRKKCHLQDEMGVLRVYVMRLLVAPQISTHILSCAACMKRLSESKLAAPPAPLYLHGSVTRCTSFHIAHNARKLQLPLSNS